MKTIIVDNQNLFENVLDFRHQIFVKEQGVDTYIDQDHYDVLGNPSVDHFCLVIKEDVVIGTCRCIKIDEHTIQLGRFAVHSLLRHQGIGLKFLRNIHSYYYSKKVESVVIQAQHHAINFYTNAGYEPFGDTYLEAGIIHQDMKLTLYQHFYTRFSAVYDQIFPLISVKKDFIEAFIASKESLLDIGCATGELVKLAQGHNLRAAGFDLDEKMITIALNKNLHVWQMDMVHLNTVSEKFDAITCVGNTLAHLESLEALDAFFKDTKALLTDSGQLLIQVVNYHKILKQGINQLPTLYNHNKRISLERRYEGNDSKLHFKNILTISKIQYHSSVELYPFSPQQIREAASKYKFKIINEYGSYQGDGFNPTDSFQYILVLEK